KAIVRPFDRVVVQPVGTNISQRRVPLVVEQPRFLRQRGVGQRICKPPGGIWKSVGILMWTRSGSIMAVALDSTISWIVFIPAQTPEKRLIANAWMPRSRISCTLAGKNTGR